MRTNPWLQAFIVLIAVILAAPMIVVAASLADPSRDGLPQAMGDMFGRYGPNTFALMALVGILTTIVGTGCAWLVAATEFRGRRLMSWLLVLPIAAPSYIIAYIYTDLLEYAGPVQTYLRETFYGGAPLGWFPAIRSVPGAALMLGLVLYPYVYLLARASFAARGRKLWLAARALGNSPTRSFWRVTLPTARPAIAGGVALVLMETLADYGVADYFAIPTFSTGIFRTWLAMGEKTLALQLAAMMLGVVVLLVAMESLSRRGRQDDGATPSGSPIRLQLSLPHSGLAWFACAVPVALGFFVPIGYLLHLAVEVGDGSRWADIATFAWSSVRIAVIASAITTILAIGMAFVARAKSAAVTKAAVRIGTLGYALPGALLAVGLLAPLAGLDQSLTRALRDSFGWNGGLVLTGTIAALCFALIIRFVTVAHNSISAGFTQISPTLDDAARSLGATPLQVVRQLHLPLLSRSIAAAAVLVFIDVLRELPATLILRPFNFETLSTRVYRLASDERLAEASTAALIIVGLGLFAVVLLNGIAGTPAKSAKNQG